MPDTVPYLTAATFDAEVYGSDVPVLVDFTATWCVPCKQMAPALDEFATENADKLKVFKVDVDSDFEIASRFDVMGAPTLVLLRDGQQIARAQGGRSKRQLVDDFAADL